MLGSFGWMELLLILFIVLIIFGARKLPQLGEGSERIRYFLLDWWGLQKDRRRRTMNIRHLEIEDFEDTLVKRSRTGITVHHPCVEHPAFAVAGMAARISRPGLSMGGRFLRRSGS